MKPDERYTWRACADGYTDTGLRKGITEGDAICRLADYEDTGLSPEEVKLFMCGTLKPEFIGYCENCDYAETTERGLFCCYFNGATYGENDWCYHYKEREDNA